MLAGLMQARRSMEAHDVVMSHDQAELFLFDGKESQICALPELQNWTIVFRDLVSMVLSLLTDGYDNVVCEASMAIDSCDRTRSCLI